MTFYDASYLASALSLRSASTETLEEQEHVAHNR